MQSVTIIVLSVIEKYLHNSECLINISISEELNNMSILDLEITTHPLSTTVIALQDVTLNCSASVDDVTYSWHRDGGSVPSRFRSQTRKTLTIRRATPPDEGRYYCIANKDGISAESNRAILTVDGKMVYYNTLASHS